MDTHHDGGRDANTRARRWAAMAGAIAVVLVSAGCLGGTTRPARSGGPPGTPASSAATPVGSSPPSPRRSPTPENPSTGAPESASGLGPVVAQRRSAVTVFVPDKSIEDPAGRKESAGLTAQLYPLLRSADVVQLNFTLTLDRSAKADWEMYNTWAKSGSGQSTTINKVELWDRQNGKIYHAGTDKAAECLCSSAVDLAPGQTVVLTAAFAAPPQGVDTLTVSMPAFGAFNDVPLQ